MGLSCECGDYDDGDWWFYSPTDFKKLDTKRSRKCCSCKAKIMPGDECAEFPRARHANEDIEVEWRLYGDEVPLASYWMCEECAGLYMAFEELGFCMTLPARMRDLLAEYHEMQAHDGRPR